MPTKVTNYQCPTCMGPLHYVGETGKLECDYCGSKFDVAEIEALYAEKDAKAAEAQKKAEQAAEADRWNDPELSGDWGAEAENMREYNCPSCGAQIICDATTAASSCPYCDNPTIVPGRFGGTLRPDLIIPFKLDKQAAVAALKKHYRHKIFLPGAFSGSNHIEEMKGIYVPFWLFDADADADCLFRGTRSFTVTEGDYRVTTTEHYDIHRAGSVRFERIPADGSTKMPDDYMDSVEPYDYSGLTDFSTAYLPGYLADKYDVSAADNADRVELRCRNSVIDVMRGDVSGYETVTLKKDLIDVHRDRVSYALMPVWTLRTKWQGREYLFMMNGQTGKMVGDLPRSNARFWGFFAGVTAVLTALFTVAGVGPWLASVFF